MNLGVSILSDELSVLIIKLALDSNNLSLLVHEPSLIVFEELVESGVSWVGIDISTSDVHGSLPVVVKRLDGLRFDIIDPLLSLVIFNSVLDDKVPSSSN